MLTHPCVGCTRACPVLVSLRQIHDDSTLQHSQLRGLLTALWETGKELALTYWIADDPPSDCLVEAALPVPSSELAGLVEGAGGEGGRGEGGGARLVTGGRGRPSGRPAARAKKRRREGTGGARASGGRGYGNGSSSGSSESESDSELTLHAHSDAGMAVACGTTLRARLRAAHNGVDFRSYLMGFVRGVGRIPHGVEEMAFDSYLHAAGWRSTLAPYTTLALHRSLLVGRGCSQAEDAFAHIEDVPTGGPYQIECHRLSFCVGPLVPGRHLATCRHSRRLDCAADSNAAREAGLFSDGWRTSGHALLGQPVVREFDGMPVRATITRWLPAGGGGGGDGHADGDGALFHCVHSDGDEEDLEEEEARHARHLHLSAAAASEPMAVAASAAIASAAAAAPATATSASASASAAAAPVASASSSSSSASASATSASAAAAVPLPSASFSSATSPSEIDRVQRMGIGELRCLIASAGLSTHDCLEKADLRQRAMEAVEALACAGLYGSAGGGSRAAEESPQCGGNGRGYGSHSGSASSGGVNAGAGSGVSRLASARESAGVEAPISMGDVTAQTAARTAWLPPGWTATQHVTPTRTYWIYHGPNGERARSKLQVQRAFTAAQVQACGSGSTSSDIARNAAASGAARAPQATPPFHGANSQAIDPAHALKEVQVAGGMSVVIDDID